MVRTQGTERRVASSRRRLAVLVVAAVLTATALSIGALARPVPTIAAYCDDYPFLCAMLAYGPEGDGSGVITTDDGFINCAWNGTQVSGTCTHRYVVPANVSWTMDPDVGSEVCAGGCSPSPLTGTAHLEEGGQTYAAFPQFRLLPVPTLGAVPTVSPGSPNPTSKPTASPNPTTKPAGTPRATTRPAAGPTSAPRTTSVPGATNPPVATGAPVAGATAAASAAASAAVASVPAASVAVPSAPGTLGPVEPAGSNAPDALDLTPIVLAIIGAGLLIGLGIVSAAYVLRRRPTI